MFGRIARRYDLMNRLMTAGQDVIWRREVIRRAKIPPGGRLLDLGAGTGDLVREAVVQNPACHPVAADFTMEMMQVGRSHPDALQVDWAGADALSLPFPAGKFDASVSGFLLRNVSDVRQVLREQYRILKPGGRMVALDTTRPPQNVLSPFIHFHLHFVIPALGQWITGDGSAYTYLPESTESFLGAEQLAARMIAAGFREVGFRRLMFGTIAIHWGSRPFNEPA
jgi:demethylmenaquinone methyltransferase/2-methoxy-6-polyprenyl-1,4-benzoquinol methylase